MDIFQSLKNIFIVFLLIFTFVLHFYTHDVIYKGAFADGKLCVQSAYVSPKLLYWLYIVSMILLAIVVFGAIMFNLGATGLDVVQSKLGPVKVPSKGKYTWFWILVAIFIALDAVFIAIMLTQFKEAVKSDGTKYCMPMMQSTYYYMKVFMWIHWIILFTLSCIIVSGMCKECKNYDLGH